jgi:xylulokinase
MTLLAIDIGTTHCKAGLLAADGTALSIASKSMVAHTAQAGYQYFDPEELLQLVARAVQEVTRDHPEPIAAIGIASMAETGLLADRRTGAPRSALIPWFDTCSQPQADTIVARSNPLELYQRFGLRASFKNSLTKLLWLCVSYPSITTDAVWLSSADFVLYHLTGVWGTDYSLASRTLAFRVDQRSWDAAWLREWGFSADVFPPALPSGTPAGVTRGGIFGLPSGIPVAVCGHDHVCAAFAVGATEPGVVFDSMGTAETLIGALPQRELTEDDYHIGLQYGCHVAHDRGYWMGSLSTSGGSVEWLRSFLGGTPISYREVEEMLASAPADPTGIIYFPYLLGSGSPHSDPKVRGAFIGLNASHRAKDLLKALLEGVAFEMEYIRRAGERMVGQAIPTFLVAGGGTHYTSWMQIKADVSGCRISVLAEREATLLGAALVAGIGCGVYSGEAEALAGLDRSPARAYEPDSRRHHVYVDLYEGGYLPFQEPLRRYEVTMTAGPAEC